MPDPCARAQLMIRPARELAGISMRELARRVGVSVGTMSGIETGKTAASPERLAAIAAELDTTITALTELQSPQPADAAKEFDWRDYPDREIDPALAAAIGCFVETGYHGATMRTVAAAAGLSAAGVYHHYPSKQSLLTAVFDLAYTELAAHVEAAADVDDRVLALGNVCEAVALFAAVRRDVMRIVVTDRANLDPADRPRIEAVSGRLLEVVRAQLPDGDDEDSAATARAVLDLCTGVCRLERIDDPADIAVRYRRFGLRLAGLDGVGSRPG
ncbi:MULTISPECIES: TetR family transcriptional regulator [Gordonia]|uniref:TetR family transcriptional regulator n=3 Tax=Gordonia TaxID=2053 RepID=A0ABN3HFL7_9ACTN|nr:MULTISPECIES: TetR family transcriptional regulator [Gordonia]AUH68705.1 helix-turn-helix domain-containing protein [Gordonia sp. YC-JH1]GAC59935.1 putative TetR family transcriptional regulator [Gordonia sihwensis NBRC 108236]